MAIFLKEQLTQVRQLNEVSYHAPLFDGNYYSKAHINGHSVGQAAGKRLFYDFYAMEFLWSFLGSGQIPKADREKMMLLDPDDPRTDIYQKSYRFLPRAATKVIDSVYEQVTKAVAKNLLAYIKMAVVQEFQYLVSQSTGWKRFRQSLVTHYNQHKVISKKEFDELVKKYIPKMQPYPDSIKRLLKYSKYYSEMTTVDDNDPFDISRGVIGRSKASDSEEYPEFPYGMAPEEPKSPEEPDETDYDAKIRGRQFGKYGGPGQPEYPDKQDWSGVSAFKDVGDLPQIPSDDDDENEDDDKKPLTEENINVKKVKDVYKAIHKAGITLDDIEKAYNNIPWGGAYGGERWGAGAVALLKLSHAKKNLSTEDMNHIIDHIYDLQHNTGSLLNKGPMYISDTDLNRRYKITDVARFIPFVSPIIRDMILRYHRYLRTDPAKADLEANMENLQNSPMLPMNEEDVKRLVELGFKPSGDHSYRVAIRFNNKQGELVHGVYYEVSKRSPSKSEKGKLVPSPDATPIFLVSDNLRADVKAFSTFDEAFQYVMSHKHEMMPGANIGTSSNIPGVPAVKLAKDIYIESHKQIKLPPDKEQDLLNINIGWRKKRNNYKAYFEGDHRLLFYAFSDGTFLITHNNKTEFIVKTFWSDAYNFALTQVAGAKEYPQKAEAQAEINAAKSGTKTPHSITTPQQKKYHLSSGNLEELKKFIDTQFLTTSHIYYIMGDKNNGTKVVSLNKFNEIIPKFEVGEYIETVHKPYIVRHYLQGGESGEYWIFLNWDDTFNFIKNNIFKLVNYGLAGPLPIAEQPTTKTLGAADPSPSSPSGKQLPPNASSKALYSAHTGIQKEPKNTIRLTKEDEDRLISIGFEPRLVGNDVWYIHKFVGDTVKFFPNDSAKVLFTSQGENISSKGTIGFMLNWLPTKYSLQTTKSPVETGATIPNAKSVGPNAGIRAGTMFEKIFSDAGFMWDENSQHYYDSNVPPGYKPTTLKIFSDRTSTLTIKPDESYNDQPHYFANLPSLIAYLKNNYPSLIANLKKNYSSDKITVYPTWMPSKMLELLEKGKYKYFYAQKTGGEILYSYRNADGDEIVLLPDQTAQVKDSKTPGYVEPYDKLEDVITYLQEKFGSVHLSPPALDKNKNLSKQLDELISGFYKRGTKIIRSEKKIAAIKTLQQYIKDSLKHPIGLVNAKWAIENFPIFLKYVEGNGLPLMGQDDNISAKVDAWNSDINPNVMTKEEEDIISNVVSNIHGLSIKKDDLTESSERSSTPSKYILIINDEGIPVFSITKIKGKYTIYEPKDKRNWTKKYQTYSFKNIKSYLQDVLPKYGNFYKSALTRNQMDWIESYVVGKLGDSVKIIKQVDNIVSVMDKNGDIFRVSKSKGVPYTIKYSVDDYLTGYGWKFSLDTFNSFLELTSALKNKFDVYTQVLKSNKKPTSKDSKGNSISILNKYYSKLNAAGFVEQMDKGEIGYIHGTDFSFKVWPNTIQWSTEYGMKEFTVQNLDEFLKVLDLINLHMSGDQIDRLFVNQTKSQRDKLFDIMTKKAIRLEGTGGKMVMGLAFEKAMKDVGFEWDLYTRIYYNYDIHQILVVLDKGIGGFEYNVFFISTDGVEMHEKVSGQALFDVIGPGGTLEAAKAKQEPLSPSGETYKAEDNAANAELIKLNEHDTELMKKAGFKWSPSENWYYKNAQGSKFAFHDLGTAEFYDAESGETIPFENIPHALRFAVEKYISKTNTQESSPFSNHNYNTNPSDTQLTAIPLIEEDKDALEKIGFHFSPHSMSYVKRVPSTSALDEVERKKKNPSPIEDKYEVIHAYNSGNASWTLTTNPNTIDPVLESKDGTIKEILDFVWKRWNKEEAIQEPKDKLSMELKKLGFQYKGKLGSGAYEYVYNYKNIISHEVQITPSGMMFYKKWETKPGQFSHKLDSFDMEIGPGLTKLEKMFGELSDIKEISYKDIMQELL
jgi:hypothetical protein